MYTMADHQKNAVQYPACSLGHVWKQRGNTTGHCARCHETFEGITLFDAHQSTGPDGRTICKPPAEITIHGKNLRRVDGSWRGPGMTEDAIARRKAARADSATETA